MEPNFAVKIKTKVREWDDDFTVLITHNGYQWQGIGLSADEMSKVIEAMQKAICIGERSTNTCAASAGDKEMT